MTDGPSWRGFLRDDPEPRVKTYQAIAIRDYDPAEQLRDNVYQDTLLSFQVYSEASAIQVTIERDPFGPVNKIVRLWRKNRDGTRTQIGVRLCPVPADAKLKVGKDQSERYLYGHLNNPWFSIFGEVVWYVQIGDRRVLEVPYHLVYEPPGPAPRIPLRRRALIAVRGHSRALTNRIAKRFGYVHEDDIEDDWLAPSSAWSPRSSSPDSSSGPSPNGRADDRQIPDPQERHHRLDRVVPRQVLRRSRHRQAVQE
jgi:hypothetical protein